MVPQPPHLDTESVAHMPQHTAILHNQINADAALLSQLLTRCSRQLAHSWLIAILGFQILTVLPI